MSKSYRNGKEIFSFLIKDKGFYSIMIASLVMISAAGYLALTSGDDENIQSDLTSPTEIAQILENDYKPQWIKDETPTESLPVINESENSTETIETPTQEIKVTYSIPINMDCVSSVNVFSGTMPVFSESMQDWRLHQGVDFLTTAEEDVYASSDGIIEDVYDDGIMGYTVCIKHADGSHSVYQSLSSTAATIGSKISAGTVIGKTGCTADAESTLGNHLHFAIIKDGKYIDPNDTFKSE